MIDFAFLSTPPADSRMPDATFQPLDLRSLADQDCLFFFTVICETMVERV